MGYQTWKNKLNLLLNNMRDLAIGIILITVGAIYFVYSRRQILDKMDKSGSFGQSIMVKHLILSIGFIVSGIILILKNV